MSEEVLQDLVNVMPLKRIGAGRDVGQIALFLASNESLFCTWSEFVCDGGETAEPPAWKWSRYSYPMRWLKHPKVTNQI